MRRNPFSKRAGGKKSRSRARRALAQRPAPAPAPAPRAAALIIGAGLARQISEPARRAAERRARELLG